MKKQKKFTATTLPLPHLSPMKFYYLRFQEREGSEKITVSHPLLMSARSTREMEKFNSVREDDKSLFQLSSNVTVDILPTLGLRMYLDLYDDDYKRLCVDLSSRSTKTSEDFIFEMYDLLKKRSVTFSSKLEIYLIFLLIKERLSSEDVRVYFTENTLFLTVNRENLSNSRVDYFFSSSEFWIEMNKIPYLPRGKPNLIKDVVTDIISKMKME